MKISFPDSFVSTNSFLSLCNLVKDYGYNGVEICNIENERKMHQDSLFRSSYTADAKRKLVNRHISISAISYPFFIDENLDEELFKSYVDYAINASIERVIIKFNKYFSVDTLKDILASVVTYCEQNNVSLLRSSSSKFSSIKNG